MQCEKRDMSGETQSVDYGARLISHIISTKTLDSYCTVLMPMGCDEQTRFAKLPNVWRDHRYNLADVLGQNRGIAKSDGAVAAKTYVLPRPEKYPSEEDAEWYPDTFLWMHLNKFLRGWSVGFDPVKDGSHEPNDAEKEAYPGVWRIYDKWELVEYSGVGLPSNIGALTNSRGWQHKLAAQGMDDQAIRYFERGNPLKLAVMQRSLAQPNKVIVSLAPESPKPREKPLTPREVKDAIDAMYRRAEARVREAALRPIKTAPVKKANRA